MTAEQQLQIFKNHLVIQAQEVEGVLSHFQRKHWKVCVFVWDPNELDANVITMPRDISNQELKSAIGHAIDNAQEE